ncbi:MAG: hypothetical protein HY360_19810 [Verrucomicrobia bacterium]|nr:hypothetical protein [Verrucomicrobiota bacterium]
MKASSTHNPFSTHERIRIGFDETSNGCPIHFADARLPKVSLFSLMAVLYQTKEGGSYAEAWPGGKRPDNGVGFELVSRKQSNKGGIANLRIQTRTEHFRVTKEFTLDAKRPWLQARYTLVSTGAPLKAFATQLQAPALFYGPDLENPLHADLIDFSFGRILPNGFEAPPYLTFWVKGRKSGFLLWTENREAMRRIFPRDERVEGVHPSQSCGSSDTTNAEWDESYFRKPCVWEFYLWPIRSGEWRDATRQLASMKFCSWNPRQIFFSGSAEKTPGGPCLSANELAAANRQAVAKGPAPKRWWHIRSPSGNSLLYAQDPAGTAPLKVRHGLKGWFRVKIRVHGGSGVMFQGPDAPFPIPFSHDATTPGWAGDHPFHNALLQRPKEIELDAGAWNLQEKAFELHPYPTMYAQSIISQVRFEPVHVATQSGVAVSPLAAAPTPEQLPKIELAGIADAPDIAFADNTLSDRPYRANVAEHARLGFRRLYWRADGQCCDFHTKVGTVGYADRCAHAVFTPIAIFFGLVLRKYNLLAVAVEEARRCGMEIYGYMRINGFGGNVIPKFYMDHPELHDEREIGGNSPRMCFYLPEFRKWKVEIAREVVRHGVDGLLIDLTRSPPMIEYHPAVVRAYEGKHGCLPPRNLKRGYVSYGIHPLETGEEWIRWWKFRAEGFTQFGRELRAMLAEEGKPQLPIHLQVRPKMALFDGLDLPVWVNEGLADLLNVWPTTDFEVPNEIFETTRGKMPVRCTVVATGGDRVPESDDRMRRVLKDPRYQGLTIYESNGAVWSPHWRSAIERIVHVTTQVHGPRVHGSAVGKA